MREADVKRAIADAEDAAKALKAELDHAKAFVAYARARMGLPEKNQRSGPQDGSADDAAPKPGARQTA